MSYDAKEWSEALDAFQRQPKWLREMIVQDVCSPKNYEKVDRKYDIEFECRFCGGRGDTPRKIAHKPGCEGI